MALFGPDSLVVSPLGDARPVASTTAGPDARDAVAATNRAPTT